jgi:hypothetical protein
VHFSKMCRLKTSESEMNIVRAMKLQGVILYTGVLNILVLSSMLIKLDVDIYSEEGISPFFEKVKLF